MQSLKWIGAIALGALIGGVGVGLSMTEPYMARELRHAKFYSEGCRAGFTSGYAAKDMWAASEKSIREQMPANPSNAVSEAIQIVRNKQVQDTERFMRDMAFATADVVAGSEPAQKLCEFNKGKAGLPIW